MGFPGSGSPVLLLTGLITQIFTLWPLEPDLPSGEATAATPDHHKEDDDHAGETYQGTYVVQLAGEETISAPPLPTVAAAGSSDQDHHQIQNGFLTGIILGPLGGRIDAAAISAHKIRIREMHEVRTEQYEDHGQDLRRLYKYTKQSVSFVSVLTATLCNHPSYYFISNTVFKVSLAMLLLAFFTDLHTALLLVISSTSFPIKCLIYVSNVTQMIIPFAILVSYNQLQPYMILIAPLPFFSIPLFYKSKSFEAMDAGILDNTFNISAGIYALSAGSALITPNIVSNESVAATLLACSLFLTAFLARYLMLISTVRPPVIVKHAETLMFTLKLLLSLVVIFLAVEFLGWQLALAAILVIYAMDVVLGFIYSLACRPRTTNSDDPSNQMKHHQQVLPAVMVAILFMALTQSHPSGHDAARLLGSAAVLRILLYFGAFLWSLNRMLMNTLAGDVATPLEGGHAVVVIRRQAALEWAVASIVVVAALDVVYTSSPSSWLQSRNFHCA